MAAEQLDFGLVITDPAAHRAEAAKKQRRCLHCEEQFASRGPGHRICRRCRSLEIFTSSHAEFSTHCAF